MGLLNDTSQWIGNQIPVNIRTFGSTMLGNRQDITKNDFTEEDLSALRLAAGKGVLSHKKLLDGLMESAALYSGLPKDGVSEYTNKGNGLEPSETYAQRAEKLLQKIKVLEASGPTISYEDYPTDTYDMLNEENWINGIGKSFTDPNWRVATTIGQAKLKKTPNGYVLEDTYDWNHNKELKATSKSDLAKLLLTQGLLRPSAIGNLLGNYVNPKNRKVSVDLGLLK